MKSDRIYLQHIGDSINAIERYTSGGREAFMRERIIQDAVIRNLEIIGEAAGKLSPDVRETTRAPWKKIVALRNRVIHAYWSVDLFLVWDVVARDIAPLRQEVERLLSDL